MRLFVIIFMCLATPLRAHPHVFIDTGLKLVVSDNGEITGVEVSWKYDALYSLLVLEDMELDDDFDGKLTAAELAKLNGFDMQWIAGYEGDLFVFDGGKKLTLGAPNNLGTSFEDGQITTRHYRDIAEAGNALRLKAYDPTYYTQYEVFDAIELPEFCTAEVIKADLNTARAMALAANANEATDPNMAFPEVGEAFADEIRVVCEGL
ncbi:DUF1007 family protein [Lentibacter algarum]|uniref:DUF1007 family protein n=1 Tax=Lentibacter algarum TaxID=576131 RepID=UPI001C06F099|nr:DUF1007 family protein [Lentibacter algarum]MBU2981966.1 DUF1007 family protein [Lentibacter algarum]